MNENAIALPVEFHFDFGSPNAYLAHRIIPAIESRTGVSFRYIPVLIGGVFKATNNVSPMVSLQGIKNKPQYQELETRRFLEKHSISDYRKNPFFPINTLQLMRGAIAAQRLGIAKPYIDTVFHAMWVESLNMGDPEVAQATLIAHSLPAAEIARDCAIPAIKQALIENTAASVARGNFGSPTFFVGEEMFFGKDKLEDVEHQINRQLHN